MARAEEPVERPAPRLRRRKAAEAPVAMPPFDPNEKVAPGMRVAAAWSWRILLVLAVLGVLGFLIVQLRYVAIPFFIGVLLAALLVPFSTWLQRTGWPKWLAVAVNELAVIAVVGGLITLIVFQVRAGFPALQERTFERYEDLKDFLAQPPFDLTDQDITAYVDGLFAGFGDNLSSFIDPALEVGSLGGHILAGLVLALFTTLFILIDGRRIWQWVVRLFPTRARAAVVGGGEAAWITLTTFVKVQIMVAAIDAIGIGVGAWALGFFTGRDFPLVIPIAIAVFLASFVPVVGAVVSGAMAVFVALVFLGPVESLVMLGIVILVQQVEGHVLQPLLVGSVVKIHPLAIVLAVATGGFVAGIPGALFAVPLVAVLNGSIGYIARGEWRTNPHPTVADVTTPLPSPRRRRAS
ncbi:AI-2E family transporter [Pseudolysinimonas sp.]|uniref:AI-2E family transporter n=1 Tax=Pseudolysinimonas sp. TaxID=2680009 RepID=UPI00378370B0